MEPEARVCPFCGQPPGTGVFCAACGRNLAAVDRLPTRAEWEAGQATAAPAAADPEPVAERCAAATAAFLAAMHAAGDPGVAKLPLAGGSGWRTRHVHAWVLRPVQREDEEDPQRYTPGLLLTRDGRFHRLESEVRGWGQRDFPRFHDQVPPDPVDMPAEEELIEELAAVLRDNDVSAEPPPARD